MKKVLVIMDRGLFLILKYGFYGFIIYLLAHWSGVSLETIKENIEIAKELPWYITLGIIVGAIVLTFVLWGIAIFMAGGVKAIECDEVVEEEK